MHFYAVGNCKHIGWVQLPFDGTIVKLPRNTIIARGSTHYSLFLGALIESIQTSLSRVVVASNECSRMSVPAFVYLSRNFNKIKYSTNLIFYALILFQMILSKHAYLVI